ncbi:MAG: glycerol-3-phosphate dehydrogenase [Rhodobacteraceae bacterium]|nr:glycerol-3-phosphate dehydrogenase [Paracoccaceae bacterium]
MGNAPAKIETFDIFVIGGGINGAGIARDAAGRGLSVALAEMKDLASATSSSSTKLFHGGLRYLEYFEFRLVREALIEREVLLGAMPHISWPMRFVLPYHKEMRFESETPTSKLLSAVMPWMRGRRPAWLIRLGLFMYDNLGGRRLLPGTATLDLTRAVEGKPLKKKFVRAFEYSDCWIDDARLVVLNARDAEARGARIMVRTRVISAQRDGDVWRIVTEDLYGGRPVTHRARALVNAGGPWVGEIIQKTIRSNSNEGVRLVRGSHIVTKKLYDHDKCYFFQGTDGRIIFAIPYEQDFTLIGTTDREHMDPALRPTCTESEKEYLIAFANQYFSRKIDDDEVVWTYSGVRPLYDDGAKSATAATRDYVLKVDSAGGAPVLNVFGGKITTYRRLAESAMDRLSQFLPDLPGKWTARVPLPGGNFELSEKASLINALKTDYPFLSDSWATRLVCAYGTEARCILGDATEPTQLGEDFGATLTEAEVTWLVTREFARCAEDIVWRRSKLGLRMSENEINNLSDWLRCHCADILGATMVPTAHLSEGNS